jgi:L-lactate dehydrogenase complex protein LldE
MHANSGYRREAVPLMRRFTRAFGEAGADAVVAPSGSCAAMVRDQYRELAETTGDAALIAAVEQLVPRVFELSEFLVGELGIEDVGAYFPHRVTYHPTCHSLRLLRVGDAPLRLLRAVRGIELAELPEATACCGFGGTFAIKNADTSTAMLTDKIRHVIGTGADVCTAGDSSCLMHIGGGLSRQRSGVRTLHLAQILASTEDAPR